jgi:hypothetical protein
LRIRAYDLGKPTSLSTLATVIVLVDHVAPLIAPDVTHMSFSDMTYSVSVAEDALANTLIKNLSVINRTNDLLPVSCEIISGNSEGKWSFINCFKKPKFVFIYVFFRHILHERIGRSQLRVTTQTNSRL